MSEGVLIVLVEVLQQHQPYPLTNGGYGCMACEAARFPTWNGMAAHQARQQVAALAREDA